jgi:hypothetical protein
MLTKLIIKRIIPAIVGLAVIILTGLWLYGYVGVKAGWIGPTEVPRLNSVSHSGAEAAGGVTAAVKTKIGM